MGGRIPGAADVPEGERAAVQEALEFMGFAPAAPIAGTPIDVAFIGRAPTAGCRTCARPRGSCAGSGSRRGVKALVVPGLAGRRAAAEREGLARGLPRARASSGAAPGCSMCLGMNPDRLEGRQICASSSNRNFKGRQGSPTGRTLLMSPAMVAAAAVAGEVVDVRQVLRYAEVVEAR